MIDKILDERLVRRGMTYGSFGDDWKPQGEMVDAEEVAPPSEDGDGQTVKAAGGLKSLTTDFMNLLKAFIGLNFMYISFAMSKAGLVRGVVGITVIAWLTYISCVMLVKVKNALPDEVRAANKHLTYGDVARIVSGPKAEGVVNGALILTQFGYCTGYLIFLAHTTHDMVQSSWPNWGFVLVPLPLLILIAQLRSVRSLGPFSAFANLSLLVGFVAVVAYISMNFKFQPTNPPISAFPIFFGQVTAALEGIGLVLPVEASMSVPKYFDRVLALALSCLTFVLMTVGVLGFVTFGEDTKSIILVNMQGSGIITGIKIVLCLGILFTYPLQLVPVVQSLEGWVAGGPPVPAHVIAHEIGQAGIEIDQEIEREQEEAEDEENLAAVANPDEDPIPIEHTGRRTLFANQWYQVLCRFLVVMATAMVAMFAGKSFGLFQSLIGSLGASFLAYTGPAYLHWYMFRNEMGPLAKSRDFFIFMIGIVGSVVGTTVTLMEMFRADDGGGG
mmetsp:Transcript_5021/g.21751  ORF Transcript_5021/g.21751 Transcript_5021/m.21751 type:complete len:501 (-) Transcript_5021:888-2390(-)